MNRLACHRLSRRQGIVRVCAPVGGSRRSLTDWRCRHRRGWGLRGAGAAPCLAGRAFGRADAPAGPGSTAAQPGERLPGDGPPPCPGGDGKMV